MLAIIFIRLLCFAIIVLSVFNCSRNQLKTGRDVRSLNGRFIGLSESGPLLVPPELLR